jgi:FkbM family methyltransferase
MSSSVFKHRAPKLPASRAEKLYPDLYRAVKHLLKDDFFILNIGANDGVDNDPIHPFLVMFPGWRGICIEPVRYNFEQLTFNYRNFPAIKLVRAAISQEQKTLYYIDERAGCDMNLVSQCCSFDREYVLKTLADLRTLRPDIVSDDAERYLIADTSIPCMRLNQFLQDEGVEKVDFLNIDVEGHDYDVFMDFDIARFKPSIICVESAGFSEEKRAVFNKIMADNDYKFLTIFGLFSQIFIRRQGTVADGVANKLPLYLLPSEYSSKPSLEEYEAESIFKFGALEHAQKILDYGWGMGEKGLCWSQAKEAALSIQIPDEYVNTALKLVLQYRTFLDAKKLPGQRICVSVNGLVVDDWVENSRIGTRTIDLPMECVERNGITIVFDLPDAASPASLDLGGDKRALAIALRSLQLVRQSVLIGVR